MTQNPPKIQNPQLKLLEKLSNAFAVTGNENEVRQIVVDEVKPLADEFHIDAMGNVLVSKHGKGTGKRLRVMLAAHMDEVGFMITSDEGKGIYRFDVVGGVNAAQLAGKPVIVGKERVLGVIGAKAIHLTTAAERKTPLTAANLRIDIGPGQKAKVKVGDWATFAPNFSQIGKGQNRILRGKAFDDRLGVATMILLLKSAPENVDLLAGFTVQEEIGLRGAKTAAHYFDPDIGIALDCTPAFDLPSYDPEAENYRYNTRLGAGPAIYLADRATIADPRLARHFSSTGDELKIPYQYRQPGGGGTDAGAIHQARGGIPSLSISVPGRYLHTATAYVRLSDWKNSVALLHAGLSRMSLDLVAGDRK